MTRPAAVTQAEAEIETRNPRAPAHVLRKWAAEAIAEDEARGRG